MLKRKMVSGGESNEGLQPCHPEVPPETKANGPDHRGHN